VRPPDRAAGLWGLLPNRPATGAEERTRDAPPPTPPAVPRTTIRPPRRAPARSAAREDIAEPDTRIVSVQLDVAILERLRDASARTTLTHGAIALRAVEEHADALSSHWTRPAASGGLFPHTPGRRRGDQATTQAQLRISPAAADVLDDLTGRWRATSRSALVNEALRRHLDDPKETP